MAKPHALLEFIGHEKHADSDDKFRADDYYWTFESVGDGNNDWVVLTVSES